MSGIEAYELLAVGVLLLAIVMIATLHLLRTYRQRRLQTLRGQGTDPAAASDRAFNRLTLARREADLLDAQGVDTERARQLIGLASRSLDARDFGRAYDLAQAAHETLVTARRRPLPSSVKAPTPGEPATPAAVPAKAPATLPTPGAPPTLAKNRAEAQFQLHLLEQDLATAGASAAKAPSTSEARTLYNQARAAFDRADYAEAFRLSLRGRRRVGGHVEVLGSPAPSGNGSVRPAAVTAEQAAEAVAAQERCPACGHPTVAGDAFCRGCGAPRAALSCPACAGPRTPTDTFCGKCGARYS